MPDPKIGETKDEFMSRCIPMVMDDGTAQDDEQAAAICMAKFEKGPIEDHPEEADHPMKTGSRHNQPDQQSIQSIHDEALKLGAKSPDPKSEIITFPLMSASAVGNELKTISQTSTELRVGNYIALFGGKNKPLTPGGRDLTGIVHDKNADGSSGEYFSKNTDFESDYTQTGALHVDFEHGEDPDGVGITSDDVLGYVDWKTAKIDDKGVFVERVLNRRKKYVQWLEELIKDGLIGNSSQAVDGEGRKTADGEIVRWPLKRDTLTVMPMEPHMLTQNALAAVKALSEISPNLKSILSTQIEDSKMELTQEQLDQIIASVTTKSVEAAGIASKSIVENALKALPTFDKAGYVQVTHDEADTPFKSLGDMLGAVKQATLTQGRELAPRLKALNLKALGANELVGSEGGFLLEPSFVATLLTPLHDAGPFSSRAAKLPIGPNSNGLTVRAVDETSRASGSRWGGIVGYRLAEAGTKLPSNPTFRLAEMRLKKYAVLCYATDELLQDTTALASIIQQGCAEELDFMVNDDILNGAGAAGPLGILNSGALVTVAKESGQTAATFSTQNVFKMWARMHPRAKQNAVWFINTDVTPQLYQLSLSVGTGGMPMYMAPGSLPQAPSGQLLGRPVIETEFNATLGTVGDIVLADMSQYAMIDRDVQAASSIHVQFLTDQVAYRFVYRCDGQPKIAAPLTPYKGTGNTLSPFVALATR